MPEKNTNTAFPATRPLIFGEVLFDTFPGGTEVLGGAPFNVAWHLHGFGMQPLLVSRIGADAAGDRVVETMTDWGMDLSGLQRDDMRPTGRVLIELQDGQPTFEILADQAYDHIDPSGALRASTGGPAADLIYHGTLALRDPASRAALEALAGAHRVRRCVDLNLRDPWWDARMVDEVMRGADWLKLNDAELRTACGAAGDAALAPLADALRARYGIGVLVVTCGADGAFVIGPEGRVDGRAPRVERIADTVGAGDAFSAVSLAGLRAGWDPATTLERALDFAAWICTVRGATVSDRSVYAEYRKKWGLH